MCCLRLARGFSFTIGGMVSISLLGLMAPPTIAQVSSLSLYNPASGRLPAQQGWFSSIPAGATQQLTPTGATDLNTSSNPSLQSGYVRLSPWNLATRLNRTTGYTLRFDLQVLAETHLSPHRAGLSVIAVSSDARAIELGFWRDRIWVQNDASSGAQFTQGEGIARATNTAIERYDLVVQSEHYCLFAANQLSQPILKGKLRNYSSFGFPYSYSNLIFIGDNTQSASAISRIQRVEYSSSAIAPCR
jgi:hypothetical protein